MHVQSQERTNQAHVDLGAPSVGKKACCVHVSGNFKTECFLPSEVCIGGDIPLHKQMGGWGVAGSPLFRLEVCERVAK